MANFLYLFWYKGGNRPEMSSEEMQKLTQKWITWVKGLGEQGHLVDRGYSLEDGGKVVRGKKQVVTDGPYAEAKDVVGGATVIKAKDIEEAVELSKGCPIFESDGMVEVRPIRVM
jgi:hypothetical protein